MEEIAGALRHSVRDLRSLSLEIPPTEAELRDVLADSPTPDFLIIGVAGAERVSRPLLEWELTAWRHAADLPQLAFIQTLQALKAILGEADASIIAVGPTIGQVGCAGHVPLATAAAGQLGAMKSTARQWGGRVRLNWLSVWTPLLFPEIADAELPEQVELGEYIPSLRRRPSMDDVARAALLLGSPGSSALTGQILMVDGGEWMLA
ncbi:SDR family oxidoreductase [Sphingomonas sp. ID0503]|uniref:SDR family oxidoreductase n=1 Tax=Sphingomonas sp. ID0503 TaxID=3399691 RepID=UPI003AFA8CE1